jgi:putative acetyltransferase
MSMVLRLDDLRGPEIARLLEEHMADMRAASPPESVHALDLDGLRKPEISFWTLWQGDQLAGCGALKALDATHAEIKSMRTAAAFRRRGVARQVLQHLLDQARQRQYQRVSLETGPMAFFAPARQLYASFGFEPCGPFADYWNDPNSVFMTMTL